MTNQKQLVTILVAAALLAGCSTTPNTQGLGSGDYKRSQARGVANVEQGIVEAVRSVTIDAASTGTMRNITAPAVGAVAGGFLGSTIGKGSGQKLATAVSAIAGGLAGKMLQDSRNTVKGIEIVVRTKSRLVAVTQADEGVTFRPGDRVMMITGSGAVRVTPN